MFSVPLCGESDIADTLRRTVAPPLDPRPAFFLVLAASGLFSSKASPFGVCALLQPRLQRNGAKNFLRATNTMLLGAMPFVVEAMLWTTIALSAVFVMYLLVRRWL